MTIAEIVRATASRFRSFGGSNVPTNYDNPIAIALADRPPMFAAGVDVEEVVRYVLDCAGVEADR